MNILWVVSGEQNDTHQMCWAKRQLEYFSQQSKYRIVVYYVSYSKSLKSIYKVVSEILHKNKEDNFELIHCQFGAGLSFFGVLLKILLNKKLIVSFRGSDVNGSAESSFIINLAIKTLSNLASFCSDSAIFVSNQLLSAITIKPKRKFIIFDGIDLKKFYHIDRTKARESLSLNKDSFILFFNAGKFPKIKGLDFIKKIQLRLQEQGFEFTLIVSKGDRSTEEMNLLYNSSNVTLFASLHEGSPNVIKEALVCGCPVISNAIGDTTSISEINSNLYIRKRTVDDFVKTIIELAPRKNRTINYTFNEEVSINKTVDRILDVYDQTCQ